MSYFTCFDNGLLIYLLVNFFSFPSVNRQDKMLPELVLMLVLILEWFFCMTNGNLVLVYQVGYITPESVVIIILLGDHFTAYQVEKQFSFATFGLW